MTALHPAAPAGTDQTVLLAAIANGEVHTDTTDTIWWGEERPLTLPEVLWLVDEDHAVATTGKPVRLTKTGRATLDAMWDAL